MNRLISHPTWHRGHKAARNESTQPLTNVCAHGRILHAACKRNHSKSLGHFGRNQTMATQTHKYPICRVLSACLPHSLRAPCGPHPRPRAAAQLQLPPDLRNTRIECASHLGSKGHACFCAGWDFLAPQLLGLSAPAIHTHPAAQQVSGGGALEDLFKANVFNRAVTPFSQRDPCEKVTATVGEYVALFPTTIRTAFNQQTAGR